MRKLSTGLAIAGLLNPLGAQALGVGDIRLFSYLNQTLRAEIPLVLSQEKLSDITIQLAPPKDFVAAGLERSYILTKLRFEALEKPDGGFVIRVGSTESIHEPFLNFLLELAWPDGRIVRDFTVLLDPPDVAAKPSAQLRSDSFAEISERPAHRSSARPQIATAVDSVPSSVSEYGPVGRNEKLWTIAGKLNQDPTITQEQMVIALFRLNPQAFSRPSVNALNAGALLKVPPRDYIVQVSPSLAREEFFRQQAGRAASWPRESPTVGALQEGHSAYNPVSPDTQGSDGVPPTAQRNRVAPHAQGDAALRTLEVLQRENSEIRVRLAELEKRVAELQVMFAERELLAPQGRPPAALSGKTSSEVDAARATGLVAQAPSPGGSPDTLNSGALPQSATPVVFPSSPNVSTPGKSMTTAPLDVGQSAAPTGSTEPRPSAVGNGRLQAALGDQADQPLSAWLLVGVAAGLGSLLTWLHSRKKGLAAGSSSESAAGEPPQVQHYEAKSGSFTPNEPGADTAIPCAKVDSSGVDPIFEADIYLSYGKQGQALETIQNALQQSPNHEAYCLKLLEIHLIAGDTEQFEQEIRGLKRIRPLGGSAFWERITELARRFHAEKVLDRALDVVTMKPEHGVAAVDETDRLIDELKRFSHELCGDPPKQTVPMQPALQAEPPEDVPDKAEEPTDAHEIPWIPVVNDTHRALAVPPSDQKGHPPRAGADHGSFHAAPTPLNAEMAASRDREPTTSDSIDSLLRELSALHYEQHCKEDESASAIARDSAGTEKDDRIVLYSSDATHHQKFVPRSNMEPLLVDDDPILRDDLETKLDLARAYADMGDHQQAREFLREVAERGSESQKAEATGLLATLSGA